MGATWRSTRHGRETEGAKGEAWAGVLIGVSMGKGKAGAAGFRLATLNDFADSGAQGLSLVNWN